MLFSHLSEKKGVGPSLEIPVLPTAKTPLPLDCSTWDQRCPCSQTSSGRCGQRMGKWKTRTDAVITAIVGVLGESKSSSPHQI